MSGEPKTITLTFEETVRRLYDDGYLLVPHGRGWSVQDDGRQVRPTYPRDTWPEVASAVWGVRVVARDEAAELRAALEDARERLRLILTAPEYDLGPEYVGSVALVGVDKADAALRRLAGGENEK